MFEDAITELKAEFGDQVSIAKAVLHAHGENESYYPHTEPDAVLFPNSTDDVSRMVKICAKHKCPIVAWGVGTSLEAQALAISGGVTLDFSQMARVLKVNPSDMNAVIQPGVTREALNEELRATGLFFPVDPGANATLGGMAATRASGTTAVRYGTMRENILALEVVLADGRVIRTGSAAKKSSAGYDLTHLMIGSEGTLGIITELTVKLYGQPEAIAAAVCGFETLEDAVNTVMTTIQYGIPVARIEFLDKLSVGAVKSYSKLDLPETPHLFLEFHGSENAVKEQSETVAEIAREFGGTDFTWSTKPEARTALWKARHTAYFAIKALRPGCWALTTDICVPISKLAEAVEKAQALIQESGLIGPILGHAGDGNFHAGLLLEPGNAEELARAKAVASALNHLSLELGGTVTGEHGIGIGKKAYMAAEHGEAWGIMADIKRALDPQNLLNPGKIVHIN